MGGETLAMIRVKRFRSWTRMEAVEVVKHGRILAYSLLIAGWSRSKKKGVKND